MPANLTPQYKKAEDAYRRANTPEEELQCLQVMLQEIPKHKGTDHLQAKLKAKVAQIKREMVQEKAAGKKSRGGVRIPRQGAGTVVLLGGPNAGKSQLLKSLTNATPEVAPYPFTTHQPAPGMMPWNDVTVQLIDTPPITSDYLEPYMYGIIRAADLALLVLDLASDDGIEQCQEVIDRLQATKTRLAADSFLSEDDVGVSYTRTFLVANKIDAPDALQRLELFHELCPLEFREFRVSAREGTGLETLRDEVYRSLDVVRVYTKLPAAKTPDMDRPYTLRQGQAISDLAAEIHNEFAKNLKFARVWGTQVHDGTPVKGDYILHDGDVVELHM